MQVTLALDGIARPPLAAAGKQRGPCSAGALMGLFSAVFEAAAGEDFTKGACRHSAPRSL